MLYTHRNVLPGTTLCNLDTGERFRHVLSIDTATGEVEMVPLPIRLAADGDTILTETVRFQAVWPILDRGVPCAFHCHGRLN